MEIGNALILGLKFEAAAFEVAATADKFEADKAAIGMLADWPMLMLADDSEAACTLHGPPVDGVYVGQSTLGQW
jgi:hypothetical protein